MLDETHDKTWQTTIAAGVMIVLAAVISAATIDRPVSVWMSQLPKAYRTVGSVITEAGDANVWIIGSLALLIAALAARRGRLAWWAGWMLASVCASGLLTNLLKVIFGRWRPNGILEPDKHGGPQYGFEWFELSYHQNGFPSGHATTLFAVVGVLWLTWPRAWWAWLPVGVALAMTRVLVNAHYLSDVMVGSWVGFTTALALRPIFVKRFASPPTSP